MKLSEKQRLKSLSVKDLQLELVRLEKELWTVETAARSKTGSSKLVRNYPTIPGQSFGNIKQLKKDIAVVKTYLTVKLRME